MIFCIFVNSISDTNMQILLDVITILCIVSVVFLKIKHNKILLIYIGIFCFYFVFIGSINAVLHNELAINIFSVIKCLLYYPLTLFVMDSAYTKKENFSVFFDEISIFVGLVAIYCIFITIYETSQNILSDGYRILPNTILCFGVPLLFNKFNYGRKRYLFIGIVSLIAIILTYSKQFYISIIILILFSFIIKNKISIKKIVIIVATALAVCAIIISLDKILQNNSAYILSKSAVTYNFDLVSNIKDLANDYGTQYRIKETVDALQAWGNAPLFGIGIYANYTDLVLKNWVHNGFIWLLLDCGVVGFIVFFLPTVVALVQYVKMYQYNKKNIPPYLHFCFLGIVMILVNAIPSPYFIKSIESNILLGIFTYIIINFTNTMTKRK